jgi:hypothetical protein
MNELDDALERTEGMLEWSQRIGSDETDELEIIISLLKKAKAKLK